MVLGLLRPEFEASLIREWYGGGTRRYASRCLAILRIHCRPAEHSDDNSSKFATATTSVLSNGGRNDIASSPHEPVDLVPEHHNINPFAWDLKLPGGESWRVLGLKTKERAVTRSSNSPWGLSQL